ncbi:MAG: DNA adenine methylase [Ostreibacterium sp.]
MLDNYDLDSFLTAVAQESKNRVKIQEKKATPFVKWVGGKRSILPEIKKHFPDKFAGYYEPFIGGGAIFFDLAKKQSFISDLNLELITTYLVIKRDVNKLITLLKYHKEKHSEEYFYNLRSKQFLDDPTEVAARFIYLNKTCYNGLYRVNKKNEFNSPFGKYVNPNVVDEENLKLSHLYLRGVNIKYQDYKAIQPNKNDLVYFDPPYHNTFLGYNSTTFDERKQIELRQFCDQLTKRGVRFILSNSDTDLIREQYQAYNIFEITAPRFINCKADKRKGGKELLILNYDKK